MKTITLLATLAGLAGSAAAQDSYYVDFGSVAFGFGTPGNTYAAAAGTAGAWNNIDTDLLAGAVYTSPTLTTTSGAASPVVLEFDPLGGAFLPYEFDSAFTTGDDQSLLDDCYYNGAPSTLTIRNLPAGTYTLYTYAMAPDDSTFRTGVDVAGSLDPLQSVGGDFSAGYQLGVTHAEHGITVTAGTPVVITFSVVTGFDSINGLQIVGSTGGGLGSNYCTPATNSTGTPTRIAATGSASVAANNVTLMASDLPLNAFGFFLTSTSQGFIANPGGSQGNLCLSGQIGRYVGPGQIQNSGATGTVMLPINLTQHPTPNGFVSVAAGQVWNFQLWHRDVLSGTPTSNFSDGLTITFVP